MLVCKSIHTHNVYISVYIRIHIIPSLILMYYLYVFMYIYIGWKTKDQQSMLFQPTRKLILCQDVTYIPPSSSLSSSSSSSSSTNNNSNDNNNTNSNAYSDLPKDKEEGVLLLFNDCILWISKLSYEYIMDWNINEKDISISHNDNKHIIFTTKSIVIPMDPLEFELDNNENAKNIIDKYNITLKLHNESYLQTQDNKKKRLSVQYINK